MKTPHILYAASNLNKLKANLAGVVDPTAINAIDNEIKKNVVQLFKLGRKHYQFATRQNNREWRQKISRLYYGVYNVSKGIRLCVHGIFSTESSDHKHIGDLPDNFPNKAMYQNKLNSLRDDRNLCDYDHTASLTDLSSTVAEWTILAKDFFGDAQAYLGTQGVTI